MTSGPLEFGDVFEYEGKDYIYLASKTDVLYAAKILDPKLSSSLEKQSWREASKNKSLGGVIYCYVILTTEELKDRAAHFVQPGQDPQTAFDKLSIVLNDKDLMNLKKEIVDTRAAPIGLREIVGQTEIRTSRT